MKTQTCTVALVGILSGALGAFGLSLLSTPAAARDGVSAGKPWVVQLAVAPAIIGYTNDFANPAAGLLFRVWSDGTVDSVAYLSEAPSAFNGQPTWKALCDPDGIAPPSFCLRPLGVVPDDPATPADVNGDGKVDGADLGLVLGDWSGKPAAR